MSQSKEDKSDSDNESSNESKSGSGSSESESESGTGSSSSSSSDNEEEVDSSLNTNSVNDNARDGSAKPSENGNASEDEDEDNNSSTNHNRSKSTGEDDEDDEESDGNVTSGRNHHSSSGAQVNNSEETNDKSRSSARTGSGSEDSGEENSNGNHSDSEDSGKPSNASRSQDEEDDDSASHNSNEDEDQQEHSSKSSYDDEDYAANKRRQNARKKAAAAQAKRTTGGAQSKKKKASSRWKSDSSDESDASEPENSSDEDASYGARKAVPKKRPAPPPKAKPKPKKKRATCSSDEGSGGSGEEQSRQGRNRRKTAVSYKEESGEEQTDSEDLLEIDPEVAEAAAAAAAEDEKTETIERIIGQRIGKKGATGAATTVYSIEESGDPNEGVDEKDTEATEQQFLIKWTNWSYWHCTWESEDTLKEQKVKGMKKLENYIKREKDIEYWRKHQAGPEDIDYYECQQELQQDLLKSYYNVERVIAQVEKPEGGKDYLCKWESLPYADSTWEDASLILKKWDRKVEEFHEREESRRTPSKHCKVIRSRPKFHHLKAQPDYLGEDRGLKLRDYQMDGLNWLILTWCKENSVILADEMGLGKTIQTICFLYYLFKAQQLYGPFLCVVPLSTMTAWQREFTIWAPEMNVVTYLGDVPSREMIRQYEWCFENKKLKFNAILTTYEILLKDKTFLGSISWAALLVDEAHRLKNDDSLLYKALEEFDTNYRLLITGTPLQNSLKELWALLHFIMPQRFDAWDAFDRLYGNTTNDKSYTKLHKELEPYILRRVKKDVEKSLPAKVEQILRVEMTSIQRQYYRWILTKNFDALRKGMKGSINTFLNIVIELKKCCNHALLTRPTEFETATAANQDDVVVQLLKGSGKLVLLDKLLCRLKETGHRVLIFSQMVRMLDILAEYLQKRHFSFQRLDGSIKGELRKQALDHFNAEGSTDFCFLLSTRAGGLGINLATADTVIIFDSDWNPQNDLQAQARAHRIGQKNQVNIYRLVTAKSVEEDIVERAKKKMVLDHLVIQRMDTTGRTVLDKNGANNTTNPFNKDELSAILKFGAEELFKEDEDGDDELVCDIDEILKRAETRDEAPGMPGDELLSAFNVTTFDFDEEKETSAIRKPTKAPVEADQEDTKDWDEIIPQKLRERVEAEERSKELNDLYLPPRRKTLQQLNQANEEGGASGGKKRKKRQAEEDSDEESDAGSEEGKSSGKKTGTRGRPSNKEKISGFNDTELRRFIKSYKKFPAPLKRLDAIAGDAELQEKPLSELKRLAELLQERCVQFMEHSKENEEKEKNSQDEKVKKTGPRAAFSIRFGGVSFNVKTLLQCVEELAPLDEFLPVDADERAKWVLNIKTRPANFDVEWTNEDDSRLLRGIYQFGIGSWEAMKLEDSLALGDKILSNDGEKKPQAKHLQSRSEYLLKIIRKNLELKKGNGKKPRKPRKPRGEGKAISAAIVHSPTTPVLKDELADVPNEGSSNEDSKKTSTKTKKMSESDTHHHDHDTNSNGPKEGEQKETHKKERKKREKAKDTKKTKKNAGPLHFTANNEPAQLNIIGDLDPSIFNECKEKMRPVKKALKTLDNPDQTLPAEEQVNQTRACLLSIGNQINQCIAVYKDPEKIKEWRSNLWYFVSKFTEFDAKKLFKLYKHALKRSEGKEGGNSGSNAEKKKEHHNHHHHHHHAKDGAGSAQNSPVKEKAPKNVPGTPQALQTLGKIKKISKKDNGQQNQGTPVVSTPLAESPSSGERRKEKKRHLGSTGTPDRGPPDAGEQLHRKERDRYLGQDGAEDDGHGKRKLEEGELVDENSKEYKRLHGDGRNNRDRDKKWDDYGDRDRGGIRGSMGGRGGAPGTPQGSRGGMFPDAGPRGPYPDERWSGRDRFSDHKRDRYDSYNRHPPSNYHRDHRDRDRGDRSYKDKRRYPPSGAAGYPNNHYGMPPGGYYPPGDNPYRYAAGYDRGGGPPSGGGGAGGRGDYDRRQPPSGNP